jgi:hypothetical protein
MVRQLERSSHTPDGLFTCYPIGDNSHNSTLQDVNKHQGAAYSKPALKCQGGSWFQQSCGHGNWRWAWAPCDKWSCDHCHRRRIREEMVPEIRLALLLAKEKGETLKFLTLTAGDGDLGGDPTAAGAKRRTRNLQHFSQGIRRKWGYFEYLKVAELTKRGRVHTHLVAIMPYINQKALSVFWKKTTGGSYVVDVEAVGMKCPRCWPGRSAPRFRKKKSMIIPPPGKGSCQNCGYKPDDYDEVARYAAWEVGKYMGKALDQETATNSDSTVVKRPKNFTRSKCWPKFTKEKKPNEACEECGDDHKTTFVGLAKKLVEEYPGLTDEVRAVAYYPIRGTPCGCWANSVWVGSKAFKGENGGLADMLLSLPKPGG